MQAPGDEEEGEVMEEAEEEEGDEEVPLPPLPSPPKPVEPPPREPVTEPSPTVELQPEGSAVPSTQTTESASGALSIGLVAVAVALFGLMAMVFGIVSLCSLRRNRPDMTKVQTIEGGVRDEVEEDDDSVIQRNVPMEDFTEIDDEFDALRQPRRLAL